MSDLYRKLRINRDNIIKAVENYLQINDYNYTISEGFVNHGATRNRINMRVNGKNMYIDVHFNSDGTTTLEDFGGTNAQLKGPICEYIKQKCEITKSEENPWFVVQNVCESDFVAVVDLIKESDYCTGIIKQQPEKYLYQFQGVYGEKLTIQYYNQVNNKIVIQGKPLLLFFEATEIVTNLVDYEDIPKLLNTYHRVNINKDDIIEQTKIIMYNSYDKIWTSKLKNSILQAVYYMNLDGDMFDYTGHVFHAYRSLEGHLRYVLRNNGIVLPKTNLHIYDNNKQLKQEYKEKVSSCQQDLAKANLVIAYIEDTYKYFGDKRHVYFHWNNPNETGLDDTNVIENLEDARGLIRETLEYIDKYFELI